MLRLPLTFVSLESLIQREIAGRRESLPLLAFPLLRLQQQHLQQALLAAARDVAPRAVPREARQVHIVRYSDLVEKEGEEEVAVVEEEEEEVVVMVVKVEE